MSSLHCAMLNARCGGLKKKITHTEKIPSNWLKKEKKKKSYHLSWPGLPVHSIIGFYSLSPRY